MAQLKAFEEPVFILEHIPVTIQSTKIIPPRPLKPVIPVEGEELELLDDVSIRPDELSASIPDSAVRFLSGENTPRQILDVIPPNPENRFTGTITLLLKIDKTGSMIQHKLLFNSTGSKQALTSAVNAARQSRWEPANINGRKVPFWIEKSYRFR